MNAYIRLVRPKQWTKNLLVFAAILFTNGFRDFDKLSRVLLAFGAMCLLSSAVYIFNDLRDVSKDRNHPRKKHRPIAAGQITPTAAALIGAVLLAAAAVLAIYLGGKVTFVMSLYLGLQVLYNLGAKAIPVLDVFFISAGFVLRAVLGAVAIPAFISSWLLLCTGALALLLGFAKRRNEFVLQGESAVSSRESLGGYNRSSLDALVVTSATAASLCYGIYALESPTAVKYPGLFLTTPFVFYGVSRYVLLVFWSDEGGEPENLLFKDKHLVISVLLFILAAAMAVKGFQIPFVELGPGGVR